VIDAGKDRKKEVREVKGGKKLSVAALLRWILQALSSLTSSLTSSLL
jgi:hypothetical protein